MRKAIRKWVAVGLLFVLAAFCYCQWHWIRIQLGHLVLVGEPEGALVNWDWSLSIWIITSNEATLAVWEHYFVPHRPWFGTIIPWLWLFCGVLVVGVMERLIPKRRERMLTAFPVEVGEAVQMKAGSSGAQAAESASTGENGAKPG